MNGIRYFRKKNHMTQNELAKALGVTQTSVSQWEGGRNYPDIKTAKRLATMFGASLDQILGLEEMPAKPLPEIDVTGLSGDFPVRDRSHDDLSLMEQKARLLMLMDSLSPLARQRVLDRAEVYYEIEQAAPLSIHDNRRALAEGEDRG